MCPNLIYSSRSSSNAASSTEPQNPFKMSDPETVVGNMQPISRFPGEESGLWGGEGAVWPSTQVGGGEQYWVQMLAPPFTNCGFPWARFTAVPVSSTHRLGVGDPPPRLKAQSSGVTQRAQHKMSPCAHQRGREMTSDPNTHLPGAPALFLLASGHLPLPSRCFQVLCVLVLSFPGWVLAALSPRAWH